MKTATISRICDSSRSNRILVVEDSSDVRAFIRVALERSGFCVVEANLTDGRTILSSNNSYFDLIITNRPEPFLGSGARVVYITSSPELQVSSRCVATIRKPFTYQALMLAVVRCFKSTNKRKRRTRADRKSAPPGASGKVNGLTAPLVMEDPRKRVHLMR